MLDELPKLPNGKIYRESLPMPAPGTMHHAEACRTSRPAGTGDLGPLE